VRSLPPILVAKCILEILDTNEIATPDAMLIINPIGSRLLLFLSPLKIPSDYL
jgi:hypothetical protein